MLSYVSRHIYCVLKKRDKVSSICFVSSLCIFFSVVLLLTFVIPLLMVLSLAVTVVTQK